MFDQILQMVQEHLNNNPQVAAAIPAEQTDAVHQEIAGHITNGIQAAMPEQTATGGLLSTIESNVASGGVVTSAIEGALVNSLGEKFGLSPMTTGAIAGMLPGLLQKYAQSSAAQQVNLGSVTGDTPGVSSDLTNPGANFGSLMSGL